MGRIARVVREEMVLVRTFADGREERDGDWRELELHAQTRVIELDAERRPRVSEYLVQQLTVTNARGVAAVLPPNSRLRVTRSAHPTEHGQYALLDGSLRPEQIEVLEALLPAVPQRFEFVQTLTLREGERRAVPETEVRVWMASFPAVDSATLEIDAWVQLAAVEPFDGTPCLRVQRQLAFAGHLPPGPEGGRPADAQTAIQVEEMLPVDRQLPMMQRRSLLVMAIHAVHADAARGEFEETLTRRRQLLSRYQTRGRAM